MHIIVDLAEGEGGRAVGTIRVAGQPEVRSFSGNLEFTHDRHRASSQTSGTRPTRRTRKRQRRFRPGPAWCCGSRRSGSSLCVYLQC